MTQAEANQRLIDREEIYFQNNGLSYTSYAAVIKKTNDFKIKDDYIIEYALSNTELFYDNLKNRVLNPVIEKDINEKELKITNSGVVSLQSEKLSKLTGGCSVYFQEGSRNSGTAGAFFKIKSNKEIYMLSNEHVIVDSNYGLNTKVVHPASSDVNNDGTNCLIGHVVWTSQKSDELMDAAIAKIDYPVSVGKYSLSPDIKFLKFKKPKIGQNVKKYGKTTKLTHGEIRSINCTVNVSGTASYNRLFKYQILTTFMSKPGDSGSILVTDKNELVGLIFAGDDESVTFANNINYIFENTIDTFKKENIYKFI
jgi:hypothetical protein